MVERGPHHQIIQTVHPQVDPETEAITGYTTNHYTRLETGLHYWNGTAWIESEELIETYPEGAIARKGPYQVIFTSNLNTAGAIDLLTPDNKRLRFHPLVLRWANAMTGERVNIATIKDTQGQILPPNQVIYPDCFNNGFKGDLIYTYGKGAFEGDVILRENPSLPPGFEEKNSRLEMVTEFLDPPEAVLETHWQKKEEDLLLRTLMAEPDLLDHTVIFGETRIVLGPAFLWPDASKVPEHVPVAKTWFQSDGRTFLIETLDYEDIKEHLATLEAHAPQAKSSVQVTEVPALPLVREKKPMLAANEPQTNQGFVIDVTCVSGSFSSYDFASEQTYHIIGDVFINNQTTIQPGAVIKYDPGTKMRVSSAISTPSAPPQAVLTAKNDHDVGVWIETNEVLEELGTNYYASIALELYYVNDGAYIEHLQIKHATKGIMDYSPGSWHFILNNRFRHCDVGVHTYWTDDYLVDLLVCEVNEVYRNDSSNLTTNNITTFCDLLINDPDQDEGTAIVDHRQRESTLLVNGDLVLVAYGDEGDCNDAILTGFAKSADKGTNFVDRGPMPHGSSGQEPPNYEGDSADPVLAYDKNINNIYLTILRRSNTHKIHFLRSINGGTDFLDGIDPNTGETINCAPGFASGVKLDKPWIAVDNFDGTGQGYIYHVFKAVGDGLYFSRSTDYGNSWDDGNKANQCYEFETNIVSGQVAIPYVTVGNNHEVYIFYFLAGSPHEIKGLRSLNHGSSWTSLASIPVNGAGNYGNRGNYFLNIQRDSTMTDVIRNYCHPQVAIHPGNGTIYLVFPDEGSLYAPDDQSDIFLVYSTDKGATWSSRIRVNDDATDHDQWCPVIAIQPDGSDLFVGFYDRRLHSANTFFHTFGAIADVSGNPPAFGPNFQISEVGSRDDVPQDATDYDQAVADNDYFYYSWTDHRTPFKDGLVYLREQNIRFSRIEE